MKEKMNLIYLGYAAYSLVFFLCCWENSFLTIGLRLFMTLFIAALALTAGIVVYNVKNDVKSSYKLLGYIFAGSNIVMGVQWLIEYLAV